MTGLAYLHPRLYRVLMFLLHLPRPYRRFHAVADEIPEGSEVLDLCSGDSALSSYLEPKDCSYRGIEANERFVRWARRGGISVERADILSSDLGEADVVVMMGSLYHFPDSDLPERMVAASRRKTIILEPVRNMLQSQSRILRLLGRLATRTEKGDHTFRWTEERLTERLRKAGFTRFERLGRDLLAVRGE